MYKQDEEILRKATDRIINIYSIDEKKAKEYAINAIEALEGHGGDRNDLISLYSVIDVVVESWINIDK